MARKKILIVIPRFEIGGTNTTLINWCSIIDRTQYDIYIFAMSHTGPLKGDFEGATILPEDKVMSAWVTDFGKQKGSNRILSAAVKGSVKIASKMGVDFSAWIYKRTARRLSQLSFDVVIAFQEGVASLFCAYFQRTTKVAMIHCNYQSYLDLNGIRPEKNIYTRYDDIITVSGYTGEIFASLLPECREKTKAIHNIIDDRKIIERAEHPIDDDKFRTDAFTIVSVGRLDPVKRFEQIPRIVSEIRKKSGRDFRWYIIGGGSADAVDEIARSAQEYGVGEIVIHLGAKSNPYPYIKQADMLVLTSISEACPNVLNEAKILGTPVVSTDFGSAVEFIENGETGFITPIEGMPDVLSGILNGDAGYVVVKDNLSSFRYDNTGSLNKIYAVIGGGR